MPLPDADDIYNYLEDYNIDANVLSSTWIEEQRDNEIIPYIEHCIGYSLDSEQTITEYHSGNGTDILFLDRKGVNSLESIELVSGHEISGAISLDSIQLIADKGVLKAKTGVPEYYDSRIFPKGKNNIKVIYKVGGTYQDDLMTAVKMLLSIVVLEEIADRTGGGALGVQGFNRNYGDAGRYSNYRKRLNRRANAIIGKYMSSVVGS